MSMSRRTSFSVLSFAAMLACWPPISLSAQSPGRPVPALEYGVDPSVRPGDDFFSYANGSWLRAAVLPAGAERWTVRNEIDALTRQQVVALLDDARTAPSGSLGRKVSDYREAYLNEAAIEARGLAPIRPLLDSIARVRDKVALTRFLGSQMGADVDPLNWGIYRSSRLLGLSVEPGINGERTNVAFLLQGGLGLPDREHYLGTDPAIQALRVRYQAYVGHMLALAGFDHSDRRAQMVVELETAIARTQATAEASANDRNADNLWTRSDFSRRAPGMDWSAYFAAAGLARQETFVVWQPTAVTGVAALVASQPLEAWRNYLAFHAIYAHADVLPRSFAEATAVLDAAARGRPQPTPRSQRALAATQSALSDAVGRMYVDRHFPPEQRARVQRIVADVVQAFRRRVETVAWMSPATRSAALAKLETLYFGVGYPEQWQDYSDLAIDPADAAGNLRRVTSRNYRRTLARLGQPVDRTEWWIAPQRVGAVLVFQQNAYNFPAALLQAPKYDPSASDAANYGAIGAIIGHEVSHFVDMLGKEWDGEGRMRLWWTPEEVAGFQVTADALGRQYAAYRPLPDAVIDIRRTQTENVADLAGLAAAFDAYRGTLGARATDREYVRQRDREFFIGFARSWRSRTSEAGLRAYLAADSHAPDDLRIATVRNLDAWYEAFDVQPGDRLYLAPGDRVRVW
jgi:putative endopeptidase